MRKTNYRLLEAIRTKYRTQQDFANHLGIDEGLVSRIINNYRKPSDDLKQRFIEALGCDSSIFG